MAHAHNTYDAVISLLTSFLAHRTPHVKGTLQSHLEGTYGLLREWGNPVELCLAGLCHAVYGTYDLPTQLLNISQRTQISKIVGPEAESIVYLYASCDRPYVYPQLGHSSEVRFRDRFSGREFVPDALSLKSFLELTFANELEIARRDRGFVTATKDSLGSLFERCRGRVSPAAFAYYIRIYESPNRSEFSAARVNSALRSITNALRGRLFL